MALIPTSWEDSGIDWTDPDVTDVRCYNALFEAIKERLGIRSCNIDIDIPTALDSNGNPNPDSIRLGNPYFNYTYTDPYPYFSFMPMYATPDFPTLISHYQKMQRIIKSWGVYVKKQFSRSEGNYAIYSIIPDEHWKEGWNLLDISSQLNDLTAPYAYNQLNWMTGCKRLGNTTSQQLHKDSTLDDAKTAVIEMYNIINQITMYYQPQVQIGWWHKKSYARAWATTGTTISASAGYGLAVSYIDSPQGIYKLQDDDNAHIEVTVNQSAYTWGGFAWSDVECLETTDNGAGGIVSSGASALKGSLYYLFCNASQVDWDIMIFQESSADYSGVYDYIKRWDMGGLTPLPSHAHPLKTITLKANEYIFDKLWTLTPPCPELVEQPVGWDGHYYNGQWTGDATNLAALIMPKFKFHA